jgi:hypothetical protein
MKYYTFYRENNNFDDILHDNNIKGIIAIKISWYEHLLIGLGNKSNDRHYSYITLKYGEDMKKLDVIDRTPIPNIDYVPKKDKNKFSKKVQ